MGLGSSRGLVAAMLLCAGCRLGFDPQDPLKRDAAVDPDAGGMTDALPAICPASYGTFAGHRYRHDSNNSAWPAAAATCLGDQVSGSSLYTHLAVASGAAEVGVLQNFTATGNIWIGLSDRAVEGTFVWVTDEMTNGYPPASGSPWTVGEPTGAAGEDCAYEVAAGTFNDGLCTATFDFVCECDASPDDPTRY